jgi:hypothetical protein
VPFSRDVFQPVALAAVVANRIPAGGGERLIPTSLDNVRPRFIRDRRGDDVAGRIFDRGRSSVVRQAKHLGRVGFQPLPDAFRRKARKLPQPPLIFGQFRENLDPPLRQGVVADLETPRIGAIPIKARAALLPVRFFSCVIAKTLLKYLWLLFRTEGDKYVSIQKQLSPRQGFEECQRGLARRAEMVFGMPARRYRFEIPINAILLHDFLMKRAQIIVRAPSLPKTICGLSCRSQKAFQFRQT